jgi:hypothetical protein
MGIDDDLHLRLAVRKASSLDDVRLMEADSRRRRWWRGADQGRGARKESSSNGDDAAMDQILEQKRALGRHGSSLLHIAAYFGRSV